MNKKNKNFFTENELADIEGAIKEAESRTSGEIVAMVVNSSDDYRDINITFGIVISAMLSVYPASLVFAASETLLRKVLPSMSWFSQIPDGMRFMTGLTAFAVLTLILYFPVKFIFNKLPSLKRLLISIRRMDAEVMERALRGFHEHGLARTRDATGILFLISVFERRVRILADHGIYAKIKQETLDRYADGIVKGIIAGKGGEALSAAIKDAGIELEKYFPMKEDDTNELSNRVVTEI